MLTAALVLAVMVVVPVVSQLASSGAALKRASSASLVCPRDDREPGTDGAPFKGQQIRSGAGKTLVPSGATGLTICNYNGMNATATIPQFGLEGIGVTDKPGVLSKRSNLRSRVPSTTARWMTPRRRS
jgi:hypothetical protein